MDLPTCVQLDSFTDASICAASGYPPPRSLSFKHSLQIWLIVTQKAMLCSEQQLYALLSIIAEQQVGKRPGRMEPRSVKRRPKAYPLLMVPRGQARQSILERGHAATLK